MLLQQAFIDPEGYKNIVWLINYLIQLINNPLTFQLLTLIQIETQSGNPKS